MRTPNLSRRIAALTLTAVALLGITACSGSPAPSNSSAPSSSSPGDGDAGSDDGTQTTAEACQLIQDTIAEATAEFENVDADDPGAVVDGMEAAAQSLADASAQITNEEVAAIVPELQAMFEQVAVVMAAIVDGDTTQLGELEEIGASFQETTQEFQDLCVPTE